MQLGYFHLGLILCFRFLLVLLNTNYSRAIQSHFLTFCQKKKSLKLLFPVEACSYRFLFKKLLAKWLPLGKQNLNHFKIMLHMCDLLIC